MGVDVAICRELQVEGLVRRRPRVGDRVIHGCLGEACPETDLSAVGRHAGNVVGQDAAGGAGRRPSKVGGLAAALGLRGVVFVILRMGRRYRPCRWREVGTVRTGLEPGVDQRADSWLWRGGQRRRADRCALNTLVAAAVDCCEAVAIGSRRRTPAVRVARGRQHADVHLHPVAIEVVASEIGLRVRRPRQRNLARATRRRQAAWCSRSEVVDGKRIRLGRPCTLVAGGVDGGDTVVVASSGNAPAVGEARCRRQ